MRTNIMAPLLFCSALLGVFAAMAFLHPAPAKAGSGTLRVERVDLMNGYASAILTGDVVGFSCTVDTDGDPQCFIASR